LVYALYALRYIQELMTARAFTASQFSLSWSFHPCLDEIHRPSGPLKTKTPGPRLAVRAFF
jgi:hypothetical protein